MSAFWKPAAADRKNRLYFDEGRIPEDVWQVLRTASLLNVGEFRVFEISYQDWYGKTGEEKHIEAFFIPYMFNDIVPFWVKHFCNKIENLELSGTLDVRQFNTEKRKLTARERDRGLEYVAWFAGAALIYLALLLRFVSGA